MKNPTSQLIKIKRVDGTSNNVTIINPLPIMRTIIKEAEENRQTAKLSK